MADFRGDNRIKGMRYSVFSIKKWVLAAVFALTACTCVIDEGEEEALPLRVEFLDVGQGLAVLLEYGGRFALYDTGPDSVGVVDSLIARGVDTLEWVVVSHNHRDHAGGFMEFAAGRGGVSGEAGAGFARVGTAPRVVDSSQVGSAARVHVRRLFVGPDTAGGFVRDSVLRVARRLGVPVDTLVRGDALGFAADCGQSSGAGKGSPECVAGAGQFSGVGQSSGVGDAPRFDVLWPPDYVREGGNPASVVLRVEFGASAALLTGDLDSAGERRLLELSPTLSAGLLQVPHHGSAGSSSLRFVAQVAPDYAVASVGAGNSYGHPAMSVVRKYAYVLGDTARFFRTDRDGSVTFELWPDLGVVRP